MFAGSFEHNRDAEWRGSRCERDDCCRGDEYDDQRREHLGSFAHRGIAAYKRRRRHRNGRSAATAYPQRAELRTRISELKWIVNMHGFTERTGAGRRCGGFPIRQRGRADGTNIGDGRVRKHDGNVYRHGGDDHKRSDSDYHRHAERKYTDRHDLIGGSRHAEFARVRPGQPWIGWKLDLHGDGVEDGRGDGDPVG